MSNLKSVAQSRPAAPARALAPSRLSRIRCMDCKRDTGAKGLKEYPLMLRDEIWLSITAETGGEGVLCRADIERRLGRPLIEADLM